MSSEAVLNAAAVIIAALLGLIGVLLGRILISTRRTHEQVANNHVDEDGNPINMRDDLDGKFEGLADLVKGVARTQASQADDIGGIRAEIRQVRADQTIDRATVSDAARAAAIAARKAEKAASDAVLALERTKPKHPTQGEPQ